MPDLFPLSDAVLERLAALGVDPARVAREARLPPPRAGAKLRLTTREYFAFWRALEAVSDARDVGLRLGGEAQPHQLSVASFAALHSPDLGDALGRLARYKRLCCPEEISVEVDGGEARVRAEWTRAEEAAPRLLVDGTFASMLALARRGTGREVVPLRVELARRRADEPLLRRHFGCEAVFDAPADLLVFDARSLAEPFVTRNEELLAVMTPGLEAALEASGPSRSLADDVAAALGRRMRGERPSVDKVARALGLGARTLQRRLGEEGTSFQAVLDGVRRRSARRFLAETDLDPGEVAFLLGFEELNSFARAFRAWEGTTPARWRRAAR